MDLLTVKNRPLDVSLPDMIMKVVTVKVAVEQLVVAVQTVKIALMILHHMDLSAVIQHGMSLVLIVLH